MGRLSALPSLFDEVDESLMSKALCEWVIEGTIRTNNMNNLSFEEVDLQELEDLGGGVEIMIDGCGLFNGRCSSGGCGLFSGECSERPPKFQKPRLAEN